jgi:hypothetical protein
MTILPRLLSARAAGCLASGWLNSPAAARRGGDIHAEMLKLLAAAGHADFKNELVGAVEIVRGAIDGNECWHFGGKALLVIGDLERAALDVDGAMRRRADESDRWQRAGGAIRPDIAVDADAHVPTRRRLDLPFDRALRAGGQHRCEE